MDIVVSCMGLIAAAPVMFLIAVGIKLDSNGPVFHSCTRVGLQGSRFGMLKFRTMDEAGDRAGFPLCVQGDPRITRFGRFLRRTKLNELPQLLNVLAGDMSMVGPRPEDPRFVDIGDGRWRTVLSVKPGIVGPNQILYRNEEALFPAGVDPVRFYEENILQDKLSRDVEYAQGHHLRQDVELLVKGIHVTLFAGSRFAMGPPVHGRFPDHGGVSPVSGEAVT